jgi:DNA-binding NarL/FixJ family response regulator
MNEAGREQITGRWAVEQKGANMSRPRLLLGDDHHILLEGMRRLLERDYEIAGTGGDGRELVELAVRLVPDIVVLDIGMPLLNGIEAARQIRDLVPSVKIVFLTQQSARTYVQEAFRAGASAYVLKHAATTDLLDALHQALHGQYYVSPLIQPPENGAPFNPKVNPRDLFGGHLTARQREVLQLVAEGKSAKEIAAIIGISIKTVEFHKASIMDELGLRTTAELTRYAIEHGICA